MNQSNTHMRDLFTIYKQGKALLLKEKKIKPFEKTKDNYSSKIKNLDLYIVKPFY